MLWFMVLQIVSTLVELIQLRRTLACDKELEIVLLSRQLAIYERKPCQPMRLSRGEKRTLVVQTVRLKATTGGTIKQLGNVIRIAKPKAFFYTARPHQGINQQIPVPPASRAASGPVRCRNVLGGIIHDYYRDAA